MKLLFITQIIDETHEDLGFAARWADAFIDAGYDVDVVCLNKGKFDDRFPVYSLGKERGFSKLIIALRFIKYVLTHKYDRVFVHMNAEYYTLGGWWWFISRTPTYLWYTHYTTHIHLKIAAFVSKRMFAATKQSLPQYDDSTKKIVTGHGVDSHYWNVKNECKDVKKVLTVHRLNRSKRLELVIKTISLLPDEYTLDVYGKDVDADYYEELNNLVKELGLKERVTFRGAVTQEELRLIYPKHRLMINMASETIDKTMVEGMCAGLFPLTTAGNAKAIGLSLAPERDEPELMAKLVLGKEWLKVSEEELHSIVAEGHDLNMLIKKMDKYISPGE